MPDGACKMHLGSSGSNPEEVQALSSAPEVSRQSGGKSLGSKLSIGNRFFGLRHLLQRNLETIDVVAGNQVMVHAASTTDGLQAMATPIRRIVASLMPIQPPSCACSNELR